MEDKKYEAGRVEISSTEYRDLVTEAVEARNEASAARSAKWDIEREKNKIEKELELANKKILELEGLIGSLQVGYTQPCPDYPKAWWTDVTCRATLKENKEDN